MSPGERAAEIVLSSPMGLEPTLSDEAVALSLLDGMKPLPCEGCTATETAPRPDILPVLGETMLHDRSPLPAGIYEHGNVWDYETRRERPHWRKEIPIRRKT